MFCPLGLALPLVLGYAGCTHFSAATGWVPLAYAAAPIENPLKGFLPYRGSYATFPHSMEWFYVPLSDLMDGPRSFRFDTGLEPLLDDIASRGHHAVFRVFLDYPGMPGGPRGIPQFLIDQGLATRKHTEFGGGLCPDYSDPKLIEALLSFIRALGERYDGDPRIAFLTVGLVGFWGEWHTYPHDDWMPSAADQDRILAAYDRSFDRTRILVRYPVPGSSTSRRIGYHDDSFAFSTLPTASWHFLSLLRSAGAMETWKEQPIGGELRPEIQLGVWDTPRDPRSEDFLRCVRETHASWLIAHALFTGLGQGARREAALEGARALGYELAVTAVKLGNTEVSAPLEIRIRIQNRGVAPFYYDWPVRLGAADGSGRIVASWDTDWRLTRILPGAPVELKFAIEAHGLAAGRYTIVLRADDPLPGGPVLRFANASQDAAAAGWLSLGEVRVR